MCVRVNMECVYMALVSFLLFVNVSLDTLRTTGFVITKFLKNKICINIHSKFLLKEV